MRELLLVITLGVVVVVGTTIGGRYRVAPPVLLICLGALVALLPPFSHVVLAPEVVLLLFLPAILYRESLVVSLREIRANIVVIALLAIGLVGVTMVTVSLVVQRFGVDPAVAWVLGAVLAPTDAAAVAGLAKRMPRRLLTTLRAESLVNDGTALVLFAIALGLLGGGAAPSAFELVERIGLSFLGGIAAGMVVGTVVILIRKRIDDPLREGALSVLTPFTAFFLADSIHESGVLAVVVAGLMLSYASPRVIRAVPDPRAVVLGPDHLPHQRGTLRAGGHADPPGGAERHERLPGPGRRDRARGGRGAGAGADALVAPDRRRGPARSARVTARPPGQLAGAYGGRLGRFPRGRFPGGGARRAVDRAGRQPGTGTGPDHLWCRHGDPGDHAGAGHHPAVPADLGRVARDPERVAESRQAQVTATQATLDALPDLADRVGAEAEILHRLRAEYAGHLNAMQAEPEDESLTAREVERQLRLAALEHKRREITAMRDRREIDDTVLQELQARLDVEEIRLLGPMPSE